MANYIKHLNVAAELFQQNSEAKPTHIALYFSLFQMWNTLRFPPTYGINREELMNRSKIGSTTTYSKCMRELHRWGLIDYQSSTSQYGFSRVSITPLDQKTPNIFAVYETTTDTSSDTSTDTTSDTSTDTGGKQEVVHLLKQNKQAKNNKTFKNFSIKNKYHEPL
ncbi:hypothetical protein [Myroides odoratus]|uniref:hypothetical protein n=1 Tax=Myroides odoratus TaxID=256 RepID=UPI00333F1322